MTRSTARGNRARTQCASLLLALCSAAHAQVHPDLSGIWKLHTPYQSELRTDSGERPALLPKAAAVYQQRRAALAAGDLSFDTAAMTCVSPGMPRLMLLPYPFQIIQRPSQLVVMFQWNDRYRIVDLSSAAPVIDDLKYMGNSSGHWQGTTLVVQSEAFAPGTLLDASGMPHGDKFRLIERYSLQNAGKRLVADMTFSDPDTFAQPWTTRMTYDRRPAGTEITEDVCRERIATGRPAFELDRWK